MKTLDFDFHVPEHLVALSPAPERQMAKLLVASKKHLEHRHFCDLPDLIRKAIATTEAKRAVVVINDTRVYPARVRTRSATGGLGEVFVLNPNAEKEIPCLLRPLKKRKVGEVLFDATGAKPLFEVVQLDPPLVRALNSPVQEILETFGEMPLPPYLERNGGNAEKWNGLDRERYQTVYASDFAGSAAAPTAGLHFTQDVLEECKKAGADFLPVTLNVGLGTFLPVKAEDVDDHEMHAEWCFVSEETAKQLNQIRNEREKGDFSTAVICVGTTSLRTVESYFLQGRHSGKWFSTDLFIRPTVCQASEGTFVPYPPQCCDALITNFHQPMSTLVMLIASLVGDPRWKQIYSEAIEKNYRLFSYGDSSILLLSEHLESLPL